MTDVLVLTGPRPLRGTVRVPGDKSISHRALLLAAVATGRSRLAGLGTGEDVGRSLAFVEALGAKARPGRDGALSVSGRGWDGLAEPAHVLDCGNSGSTLRMGLGLLAGRPFHATLTGDGSLVRRPMARVVEPLRRMGAHIDGRDDGRLAPLSVRGGGLAGIRYDMPVASAQVKTALVLAGLQAEGETVVVEPAPSRDHTERLLAALGAPVEVDGGTITARPGEVPPFELEVPGDPSSAAFFVVAALVTPGSEVTVEGVSLNPLRVAYLDVLRRMGADVEARPAGEVLGEPVGSITARASSLQGTEMAGDEIPSVIDEIPVLAVAAAYAEGVTEIRDAEELAVKETNRIGAVEQELTEMGVKVVARRDGLTIEGGLPRPGTFKSHGDHRVAMAAAVAANAAAGESTVKGWGAASVSYPEFAHHLDALAGTA